MSNASGVTNTEAGVFRLAKPLRKGILRLIFSRFLLIALLFALQLLVMIAFYGWLGSYLPHLQVVQALFTLIMVVYLFNSGMDSSAKLTWMLIIAVLPVVGAGFLWFTQTNLGHRAVRKRVGELIDKTRDAIPQSEAVKAALAHDGSGVDDLSTYLCRGGCFPVFDGTETQYFPSGEAMFADLLTELKKAERFIFLEYFIIEEGWMWGEILRVLIEKAAAGVDVRVMYDGMCEMATLPFDYNKLLEKQGIRAKAFSPIRPAVSSHYNYRDHRKILVIDGRVAYTGGVNLADEYINRVERFGHWKDVGLRLRGEAVRSFTLLFLQMWNLDEKEPVFTPFLAPVERRESAGFVLPYGDSPLDSEKAGETVYMDLLNRAADYVHIMTPYLILDGELEAALKYAAERGVDVKLILPGIPDKKLAWALAKSHYASLLASGVKLFEYTPGFVHAKVCVADGSKAVVGTINLDYRSLYHHFECAAFLYKTDCIADIEEDFQQTLTECRAVTAESIKDEALFYKLVGPLLKFIAPLM